MPTTIAEARAALQRRDLSTVELVTAYLDAISERNGELNAYLDIYAEQALEQARQDDGIYAKGSTDGSLRGIPIAVKDNILIKGHRATAGSKILETHIAAYNATAVAKLTGQGAIFLGKTNLDEFAMGSSTENSAFGPTKNPHDPTRVAGGTSGGSAAAVAAGLALAALGSDTGGSIRQPASFCGVVGLKPTYGAVSRSGLIATVSSMDQIGPLARTVNDARILFEAICGRDPLDATTVAEFNQFNELKNSRKIINSSTHQLIVGVPKEYFGKGLDPQVEKIISEAIAKCEELGARVQEVALPHSEYALPAYYIINFSEVSANLARFDGIRYGNAAAGAENLLAVYEKTRADGFGPEVKRRIMLGTYALSAGYYDAYYLKAQQVRRLVREDFERGFEAVDFILGPVAPTPAFKFGEKTKDPLAMYLADIYTVAANLAGLPALSLPAGWVEREGKKLPVGLQVIAPWFTENRLLDFAEKLEAILGFQMTNDG